MYARRATHWRTSIAAVVVSAAVLGGCDQPESGQAGSEQTAGTASTEPSNATIEVANVGFDTPESVLHDPAADVYIVSNIGGDPATKDNNGFLSRLSPTGEVIELRWVAGGQDGVVLHAPKGLALKGDTLFVTDIDSLRAFHRETGAPLGARGAEGAGFLNDPAVGADGAIYVTDSGLAAGPQGLAPNGSDAVYRFAPDGTATAFARTPELSNPNGVIVDGDALIIVPFGSNEIYRLDVAGMRTPVAQLPGGQIDGIVRVSDGSLLASSWEAQAVFRVDSSGTVTPVVEGVSSPADIGYDATRNRVLVPVFTENRVMIVPLN